MDQVARRRLALALGVVVGLVAIVLSTDLVSARAQEVLSDTSFVVVAVFATVATVIAARRSAGRLRTAWWLLAASTAAWTVGNLLWFQAYVIQDGPTGYPTWYDLFYLAAPMLAVAGLLAFPGRVGWGGRYRILLDGMLLAVSLLYVSWELVLRDAFDVSGLSPLGRAAIVGYPLADVVACTFGLLLVTRARPGARTHVVLVTAGFILWAVADTIFARQSLQGTFQIGTPIDLGWIVGPLLVGFGALEASSAGGSAASHGDERIEADSRTILAGTVITFIPLLGAFIVSEAVGLASEESSYAGSAMLLALVGLFLGRQLVTLRENLMLTRSLEGRVADRTADVARAARQQELTLMAVADGIVRVGVDGRVLLANDAAHRIIGASPGALIGSDAHDLLHGSHDHPADNTSCPLATALGGHDVVVFAADRLSRTDGTTVPAEIAVTPIAEAGRQLGAVVVFRDVTQRHEVDRMKDEFISVVSHELRTPLTSIRGSLGLLAGGVVGDLPERGKRMVDIAVDNTDRLIRLINDILDIERIESGSAVMQKAEHDVASVVAQAMRLMLPVAREAGVQIGLAKIEGRIWADQDRMVQTLTNLLSNAVKFSPPQGLVTVTARHEGAFVLFTVADEGRGIPSDELDAVFGRFHQVDASDSRDKGGTGLGLAICRTIVEQHGGRIWVDSPEGAGAAFSFTIPAVQVPSAPPPSVDPEGDGPLVLVCDDDASLREVVGTYLAGHGYRRLVAHSGAEAVRLAKSEQPAVIVLDLFMPGMDGWQTVSSLKADPATAAIPIVVLTVLDADEGAGLADLVESWITKPFTSGNVLLRALEQVIHGEGHTPRVLIVEDDLDLAAVLVASFERHGVRVVSASTAEAAVRLSRTFLPDLIILDLVLPDGDGFAVVDQLRHDGRLASVPLVVYTARDVSEDDRRRLTLGETTVLFKSKVTPEAFERQVLALLDRVTGGGDGAGSVSS